MADQQVCQHWRVDAESFSRCQVDGSGAWLQPSVIYVLDFYSLAMMNSEVARKCLKTGASSSMMRKAERMAV